MMIGTPPKRGKRVNIYLHDADQVRIRELAAYLASEGLPGCDSQIIKAALLLARPDKRLLKACQEIEERINDTSGGRRNSGCAENGNAAWSETCSFVTSSPAWILQLLHKVLLVGGSLRRTSGPSECIGPRV
jgi:hypothetical protein